MQLEKGIIRPAGVSADSTIDHKGMQELPHRGDEVSRDGRPVTKKKGVPTFLIITLEDIMRKFRITIVPNPEKIKPPDEPST